MKTYRFFLFITFLIYFFPSSAICFNSLKLAETNIYLGMERQEFVHSIRKPYWLQEQSNGAFIIFKSYDSGFVGAVGIKNNQVNWIQREWPGGSTPEEFVKTFFKIYVNYIYLFSLI